MKRCKSSVIVPTRNRSAYLELSLVSFLAQSALGEFEIVVVDDGGSDDSAAVVARYADRLNLRYVRCDHSGRSAARNAGIAASSGELLIFSDDDRIVAPRFVEAHAEAFHASSGSALVIGEQRGIVSFLGPSIALRADDVVSVIERSATELSLPLDVPRRLLSPRMLLEDFDGAVAALSIPEPFWQSAIRPVLERFGSSLDGFHLGWAIGATGNLSVARRWVEDVGGFDAEFSGWGLEDADLHYRLSRAGARTRVALDALSYHQAHERGAARMDEWRRNACRFLDKHSAFEASAYVAGLYAGHDCLRINALVSEFRAARAANSLLADELLRLTTEHARLLVRVAPPA